MRDIRCYHVVLYRAGPIGLAPEGFEKKRRYNIYTKRLSFSYLGRRRESEEGRVVFLKGSRVEEQVVPASL